jgi:aminomuconate-semialdehyde/2-hydroxymuconate-6-semialdehyde dehydrogenase
MAGKPIKLARDVEIPRAISNLRFFAHEPRRSSPANRTHGQAGLNYTLRMPLGVVATISPWNLPLYLFTWKIAPALAAGNTVVAKPSEITPHTATMLAELAAEIGFPAGVLNVVHGLGPDVGEPMVLDARTKAVSFTGSTLVGKRIATMAAPLLKKVSLELGGKNPTLVFADSDWERNLDTIVRSAFQNSGQICLCGSRLLVQRSIYAGFRDAFVERARRLQVGNPLDAGTELGPLVSRAHFDKVLKAIARAKDEGGQVRCGGKVIDRPGWFVAPTVIDGLGPTPRPTAKKSSARSPRCKPSKTTTTRWPARTPATTPRASVWTRDLARAHRFARNCTAASSGSTPG